LLLPFHETVRFSRFLCRTFIIFPRTDAVALSAFPAYEFDSFLHSVLSIVKKPEIEEEKQKSPEEDQKDLHHVSPHPVQSRFQVQSGFS
jgi:hypothetical protein